MLRLPLTLPTSWLISHNYCMAKWTLVGVPLEDSVWITYANSLDLSYILLSCEVLEFQLADQKSLTERMREVMSELKMSSGSWRRQACLASVPWCDVLRNHSWCAEFCKLFSVDPADWIYHVSSPTQCFVFTWIFRVFNFKLFEQLKCCSWVERRQSWLLPRLDPLPQPPPEDRQDQRLGERLPDSNELRVNQKDHGARRHRRW